MLADRLDQAVDRLLALLELGAAELSLALELLSGLLEQRLAVGLDHAGRDALETGVELLARLLELLTSGLLVGLDSRQLGLSVSDLRTSLVALGDRAIALACQLGDLPLALLKPHRNRAGSPEPCRQRHDHDHRTCKRHEHYRFHASTIRRPCDRGCRAASCV